MGEVEDLRAEVERYKRAFLVANEAVTEREMEIERLAGKVREAEALAAEWATDYADAGIDRSEGAITYSRQLRAALAAEAVRDES